MYKLIFTPLAFGARRLLGARDFPEPAGSARSASSWDTILQRIAGPRVFEKGNVSVTVTEAALGTFTIEEGPSGFEQKVFASCDQGFPDFHHLV